MTDARAGKVAEKILVVPLPDARVGKIGQKILTIPFPEARVAKVAVKVMVVRDQTMSVTGLPIYIKQEDGRWMVLRRI